MPEVRSDPMRLLSELVAIDSVNPGLVPAADLTSRLGIALGTKATFDAPYWMEAPLWQQLCPTLICGPSGGGIHAADEWVDLRQVVALSTALVTVLGDWRPDAD